MKDLNKALKTVIEAGAQDIAASRGNVTRHTLVDLQRWADALPVYAADVAGEKETDAHTPGPWIAYEWAPGWSIGAINAQYTVANLSECNNARANARLIAAAPELLEVCQAIAELNQGQGQLNMCMVANWAEQVINDLTK